MSLHPDLRTRLGRLVGTWHTAGRIIDGGEHDGAVWEGHDVYEWFPGENVLVHRVDVDFLGDRQESLELFAPRPGSADAVDQTSYAADGSIERATGSFDDEGRYLNVAEDARARLTFDGHDAMRASWELRAGDSWSPWMELTFARVGPPHIEVRLRRIPRAPTA